MNKELFVSSTPHETKVGLVEDDLLAEIYLERENEYTLAGSIYKGRVTRVLPGMQSAFVDIGLERDAFLYVSDFMELEEHDDDLTDVVPATRMCRICASSRRGRKPPREPWKRKRQARRRFHKSMQRKVRLKLTTSPILRATASADAAPEPGNSADSQNRDRDRGSFRGRRRRGRGGRRDGRGEGSRSRIGARSRSQCWERRSSRPRRANARTALHASG